MTKRGRRTKFICIYEIKSISTGRVYIGSSKDVFMRWNSHIYDILISKHSSKELLLEYLKYGISNFTFRILELLPRSISPGELRKIEQGFIDKVINPFNKRKAFNK